MTANTLERFSPVITLMGLVLLLMAMPLSHLMDSPDYATKMLINFGVWVGFITWISRFASLRQIWVIYAFLLTIFAFKKIPAHFTAYTLSIVGFGLFVIGSVYWPRAHALFSKIGRIIECQRLIPLSLYLVFVYGAFLLLCVFMSWHLFKFIPGYDDSISQYIHGKFFAHGMLYGETPTNQRFFPVKLMVNDGKWYAAYQPLHSMFLAAGHYISAPWIINPLAGALTVLLIVLIARRIFDEATARIAGLLAFFSGYMIFMSSEYMNHSTTLLFTTLLIYAYITMLDTLPQSKKTALVWACVAGLSLGAVFLIRPLTAVGVGLPFMFHALLLLKNQFRTYFMVLATAALGGLICLYLALYFNYKTTGEWLLFATGAYHRSSNIGAMGFRGDFSWFRLLLKSQAEWGRLNAMLFATVLPSGFFVMIFCLFPIKNRGARFLLAVIISHTLVNLANQYNNIVFGPRYLYEVTSCMMILSAAGMRRVPMLLGVLRLPVPKGSIQTGLIATPIILVFVTGLWTHMLPLLRIYERPFFDNDPKFYMSMLEKSEKPALIFIGRDNNPEKKYAKLRFTNPPLDNDEVIFALDRGDEKNSRLMERYAGRHTYVEWKGVLLPVITP
jgi:hypothetical protein